MTDIALTWQLNGLDIALNGADLLLDNSVTSAVIVSLFTDRRALDADELPSDDADRRGWWGDSYNTALIGSRLWLLSRSKQIQDTLKRAEEYAHEALLWMTKAGRVNGILISATAPARGVLKLDVHITLLTGDILPLSFKTNLNGI